jgi:hypothetical protein
MVEVDIITSEEIMEVQKYQMVGDLDFLNFP